MDEQNNTFPEEFDFLKSMEADHVADAEYTPAEEGSLEHTQIFDMGNVLTPSEEEAEEPAAEEPETEEPAAEEPEAEAVPEKPKRQRKEPKKLTLPKFDMLKDVNPRYMREVIIPGAIAAVALLLCVVFIFGSVSHRVRANKEVKAAAAASSKAAAEESQRIQEAYVKALMDAEDAAEGFDYEGAIRILDSFTGNPADYPDVAIVRARYAEELEKMTVWNDPSQVINLSFHVLIADARRAFNDDEYGANYEDNFITTDEFSKILNQLYANGYMLISFEDIIQTVTNADGSTGYAARTLYLPDGKKPLILTQTNANYYTYMVDGDGDGLPDADGDGFASRLVLDNAGNFTCELIDANGNTMTGAFDMVPILEEFIKQHPDFSYRNARAVIATSGYDGVFGYRVNKDAEETLGTIAYQEEVAQAKQIAQALKEHGYKIACYTYDNIDYDSESTANIQIDLHNWATEITPVIGATDILVYARNSDISDTTPYSGDKYNALKDAGFHYFLGVGGTSKWASVNNENVRQFRMTLTGEQLVESPEKYSDLFDASAVLSDQR